MGIVLPGTEITSMGGRQSQLIIRHLLTIHDALVHLIGVTKRGNLRKRVRVPSLVVRSRALGCQAVRRWCSCFYTLIISTVELKNRTLTLKGEQRPLIIDHTYLAPAYFINSQSIPRRLPPTSHSHSGRAARHVRVPVQLITAGGHSEAPGARGADGKRTSIVKKVCEDRP